MITTINSDVEYKTALREVEALIDRNAKAGTSEGDRLNLLTLVVQDYEQKHIESHAPDPIEALKFRMEQMALTPRDLVPLIPHFLFELRVSGRMIEPTPVSVRP